MFFAAISKLAATNQLADSGLIILLLIANYEKLG